MKNIVIFSQKKQGKILENVDGILIGIHNLSSCFPYTYSLDELCILLQKNPQIEFFVALNKNILNHELPLLKDTLQKLKTFPIKAILYYDLAVLQISKKYHLDIPLYWAQEHFTTNYLTANYYQNEGVEGILISADIMKQEIDEIRKNTTMKMIVPVFGYLPIFVSRRRLIQNYQKTFDIKEKDDVYFLRKENKRYPIIENEHGTNVFSAHILNAASIYSQLKQEKVEYALLNGSFIDENVFMKIIDLFKILDEKDSSEVENKIEELCLENTDTGFLFRDTIYKIKK